MFDLIGKIPFNRAMSIVVIVFGSLIAPYWYLFNWFPELIINKDIFHVLLLCMAVSCPQFIIMFVITLMGDRRFKRKSSTSLNFKFKIMAVIAFTVGLGFYIPIALYYEIDLTRQHKIRLSIWIQTTFLFASFLGSFLADIQRKYCYAKIISKRKHLPLNRKAYFLLMANKTIAQFKTGFNKR